MTTENLREALERLRAAMEKLDPSDEVSRGKLKQLIDDVGRRLNDSEAAEKKPGLTGMVENAVRHFEVEHPRITAILNEISTMLSNIGL